MQAITKVQIEISGRQVLVDSDQVKLHQKKWALVKETLAAQASGDVQLQIANTGKIISLNRRIHKNVQFV